MCIYLIRNKVNGKGYVGRTKQPPVKRWSNHRTISRNANSLYYNSPLYRAFRKHGIEQFDFSVLEWVEHEGLLADRETYHIDQLGTMSPNGYNLERYQAGGIRVLRPSSLKRQRAISHGRKSGRTSAFKGVFVSAGKVYCQIEHERKVYSKGGFKTEKGAAESYDKMARFLFGSDAQCNFNPKTESDTELQEHFEWFTSVPATSVYRGVSRSAGRWRCTVVLNGKPKSFGSYTEEREAAEAHDIICLHLGKANAKLNFPDRAPDFMDIDPASVLLHGQRTIWRNRKGRGTVRQSPSGRFQGQCKSRGRFFYCGMHDTEALAWEAVASKRAQLESA